MNLTKTFTTELDVTPTEVAALFANNDSHTQALVLQLIAIQFNEWGAWRDKQLLHIVESPFLTSEAKAWIKDLAEFIEATK